MKTVDLRSDTVTKPTMEMREAMAHAEVGDDVLGEDPTVKRLEATAAAMIGKEAALFVASGTMGNQVAVLSHTARGNEVIVDDQAHIFYYEVGAPAILSAVQLRPVTGLHGPDAPKLIKAAVRDRDNIHYPETSLICLENTHNRGSGTIMAPEQMQEIYELAKQYRLSVHVDGARIFNAAVALGRQPGEFSRWCDSIMFCLSKGLGAPVGSMLAGSRDFIDRARKYRKALGGGMRQAGILAAAGLVALGSVNRLAEDHVHAKMLAQSLAGIPGVQVDLNKVQTNIIVADVSGTGMTSEEFVSVLEQRGVLAITFGPTLIRLVTHRDVSREDVEYAIDVINNIN
ncbi:L-threonine aldolase [Desulfotomaculum arcticum]|uniref:L-threonine aldolase n=1 Tax=Desulfotruncus arcticus DSM 17038 TaxID=1121424 RepID=A0A1I2TUX8_9FIRM|nr:low-specificity L-threonine aldolase [Desulfotruncus arcticus]SFG68702.1 L-threonine aldolase [Desulfotomaculum arcticum] [Desulfotruncus arcticus DSM 17038]